MGLDDIDRKLLNLIQGEFPLGREPFCALGLRLGISAGEVIRRIERQKAEGIVRLIGPVFDARSLGYRTTLVAMRVAESRLDKAAQVISKHPGVSHGYQRDNRLNLWFTLSLPSEVDIQSELGRLNGLIGAEAILDLPALRVFKIGAYFDAEGEGGSLPGTSIIDYGRPLHRDCDLSPTDRALINELQQDLLLVERPFDGLSARLGMDIDRFLDRLRYLEQHGIMRRFGAAIRHDSIGFVANAMACWIVPRDMVEAASRKLVALEEVSHCYERKTDPLWPYNLFAMIHGRTKEACQDVASQVSRETGFEDYLLLFSIREFKKVRVKYLV
jgi:DNA-binding Lrp family transcriptional regulator